MEMIQSILVETPRPTKAQIEARDAPEQVIEKPTTKPKKTWSRKPKPKE